MFSVYRLLNRSKPPVLIKTLFLMRNHSKMIRIFKEVFKILIFFECACDEDYAICFVLGFDSVYTVSF